MTASLHMVSPYKVIVGKGGLRKVGLGKIFHDKVGVYKA